MKKLKAPMAQFADINPNNFHARWEGVNFGLVAGIPISLITFRSMKAARDYFILNRIFLSSLLERMDRFIEASDKANWHNLYTLEEEKK